MISKSTIAAVLAIAVLILDSSHTLPAASEGLQLCIRTAIPSLFPFFVLSGILVPGLSCIRIPWLRRLLHVPAGWESVFLLGCIGGYPIGAQCICQGYRSGHLSGRQARRMLGFCNNCGPSFLFGVTALFFPHPGYAAGIMGIGILSAMCVGHLWPDAGESVAEAAGIPSVSRPRAVKQAIHSMANVCAWIILGKILADGLRRTVLPFLPGEWGVLLTGLVELTNGCMLLGTVEDLYARFMAACVMCVFGGVCVAMQVSSICADAGLSAKGYLMQKVVQAFFAAGIIWSIHAPQLLIVWILFPLFLYIRKTAVAFPKKMVYNTDRKGGYRHAVPKKN